jgi:subtilisin family serine protease
VDWDANTPDYVASGDEVVISAPGVGIQCGGWVDGAWRSEAWGGGSSQATAIVSGALALVRSAYPEATGNQLVQHLIRHTTDDTLEFWPEFGFGLISVTEMLAEDPTRWADVNPLTHVSSLPSLPEEYPDEAALASAAGAASGSPTASSAPTDSTAPTASAGAPAAPGDASEGGGTAVAAWVVGALVLAGVVAAAVVVARRRAGPSGAAAVQVSSSRGGS